jgi:hypothetical protein
VIFVGSAAATIVVDDSASAATAAADMMQRLIMPSPSRFHCDARPARASQED